MFQYISIYNFSTKQVISIAIEYPRFNDEYKFVFKKCILIFRRVGELRLRAHVSDMIAISD